MEEKIQRTADFLKKRAAQRKRQTDKHREAETYQPGTKVCVKIHRRSDASRRLIRKIHLVYDGPYLICNEIRLNAYTVEDENGDTVGVFNSRLLKPHREAKLKPVMEINMIRTDEDIVTIPKGRVETFCRDLKNKIVSADKNEDIRTLEAGELEQPRKRPRVDDGEDTDEDPGCGGHSNLKRRKSGKINEKGMRHISRITKIISERKQLSIIDGMVNGQPMEIVLNFRGEFNVITKAALKIIEMKDGRLQRLYQSKSIPSYLKKEKKVKFKAVSLEIEAYFEKIEEEAMILPDDVPCILIGRHACKKLGHINRVRERKDETYVLSRWDKRRSARVTCMKLAPHFSNFKILKVVPGCSRLVLNCSRRLNFYNKNFRGKSKKMIF